MLNKLLALLVALLFATTALAATFEEQTGVESFEVLADGQVQVREVTRVLKDGAEVGSSSRRYVLDPGTDEAKVPEIADPELRAVVEVLWTPEVIAARKAELEKKQQ